MAGDDIVVVVPVQCECVQGIVLSFVEDALLEC
jgi:hypothetical protein